MKSEKTKTILIIITAIITAMLCIAVQMIFFRTDNNVQNSEQQGSTENETQNQSTNETIEMPVDTVTSNAKVVLN